jgi:dipeptidyl aminopeptidase/acylaminoacyl peptidase
MTLRMPTPARRRSVRRLVAVATAATVTVATRATAQPAPFTLDEVKSYPYPNELAAAATGTRIAWAMQERGQRNIYVAEGPAFTARRLTSHLRDDGQELSSVSLSPDGQWVVYIRGGDFGSNWDGALPVNPTFDPVPPKVQVWSVPFAGGEPRLLGEGDSPVIAPGSDVVLLQRGGDILRVPIDGSRPPTRFITARGTLSGATWSPDGRRVAFVAGRGDHAFIGVYENDSTPIRWIAPSAARDRSPRWSPDGSRLAFVRTPGAGGAPDSILAQRHAPWSIWVASVDAGTATAVWTAPTTLRGSVPNTHGGTNLHWGAGDRIAFVSYMDGWPQLYSVAAAGGPALQLTAGRFMLEHISLSPDRRTLVASANAGDTPGDHDRRHVIAVPVDRAAMRVLTPGTGLEWTPVVLGDNASVAMLSATAQRPPLPAVMPLAGGTPRLLAQERIPAGFPASALVTPRPVSFTAPDGMTVYGQLFEPRGAGGTRRPAVIYVHGGPPRQMLLGWHYSDYYANAYAMNQYLASRGFVVLSVNYRLGIGYGYEFHNPPGAGARGAAEYQDVKAAGEWLRTQSGVDPARIGIYGGSYGGFLTAMALARDSDLFAAGVDIHGVHDWTTERARGLMNRERYEEAPDLTQALEVAWRSSPVSSMATWRSPVLLIHGDDDRNVRFSQTTDLVRRLEAYGVPHELLVIPDDTHHFMRHANWLQVNAATADFLERRLQRRSAVP